MSQDDRTAAHALIDARIAERAAQESFGSAARAAGHATASIDNGQLVEIAADGRRHIL